MTLHDTIAPPLNNPFTCQQTKRNGESPPLLIMCWELQPTTRPCFRLPFQSQLGRLWSTVAPLPRPWLLKANSAGGGGQARQGLGSGGRGRIRALGRGEWGFGLWPACLQEELSALPKVSSLENNHKSEPTLLTWCNMLQVTSHLHSHQQLCCFASLCLQSISLA